VWYRDSISADRAKANPRSVGPVSADPALSAAENEPFGRDLSDRPFVAFANFVSVVLMEILCPFCWEALVLLYLLALFTSPELASA
jgi:hypothetical protein